MVGRRNTDDSVTAFHQTGKRDSAGLVAPLRLLAAVQGVTQEFASSIDAVEAKAATISSREMSAEMVRIGKELMGRFAGEPVTEEGFRKAIETRFNVVLIDFPLAIDKAGSG